jgi:UDP-N-acetyl-2-amino-2-deoxyglucuronate dehydrogenase
MLTWIFGDVEENIVHEHGTHRASGFLQLKQARVRWILSVNENDLPQKIKEKGQRTYRSITVNGDEIEFSQGFTDLHTKSYMEILKGNGFGLEEARKSIEIVHKIRNSTPIGLKGDYHPLCK